MHCCNRTDLAGKSEVQQGVGVAQNRKKSTVKSTVKKVKYVINSIVKMKNVK